MKACEIPLIIPALEPDERLPRLLAALRQEGLCHIVLVNDGSGPEYDGYFRQAEQEFGCTVLHHAVNLGKGRALKTAFNYCLHTWPGLTGCVTADSDGQHSPACILACMKALAEQPDHLVLGVRDFSAQEVPFNSRWGNRLTCQVLRTLCGVKLSDTQTGLRGIPADFMRQLMNVPGERFEFETNMLIESREKFPILEVPIETIYDSRTDHATHFNPLRDSLRIYAVFGKFMLSSLSSTLLDLAVFQLMIWLLSGWLGSWYITAATVIARVCSAMFNFRCNQKLVFRSDGSTSGQALRYALLCVVQTAASAGLVTLLHGLLGGSELLVKIPVDVLLFFISFQIQRRFVFVPDRKS